MPLFGVHGYAGIIAHMFMGAGSDVEQRSLAAVGVAHQGDADDMAPLLGQVPQGRVQPLLLLHLLRKSLEVFVCLEGFPRFRLGCHLNLAGFFPPEREFVADNLVFNRVFQRGVQHDTHFLSLDKAHLYQAFSETPVPMDTDNHGFFAGLQFR